MKISTVESDDSGRVGTDQVHFHVAIKSERLVATFASVTNVRPDFKLIQNGLNVLTKAIIELWLLLVEPVLNERAVSGVPGHVRSGVFDGRVQELLNVLGVASVEKCHEL